MLVVLKRNCGSIRDEKVRVPVACSDTDCTDWNTTHTIHFLLCRFHRHANTQGGEINFKARFPGVGRLVNRASYERNQ